MLPGGGYQYLIHKGDAHTLRRSESTVFYLPTPLCLVAFFHPPHQGRPTKIVKSRAAILILFILEMWLVGERCGRLLSYFSRDLENQWYGSSLIRWLRGWLKLVTLLLASLRRRRRARTQRAADQICNQCGWGKARWPSACIYARHQGG